MEKKWIAILGIQFNETLFNTTILQLILLDVGASFLKHI